MSAKIENSEFRVDWLKWLIVVALVIGAAFANSYYAAEYGVIYRVLGLVAVGVVACLIAVNTAKGRSFWELLRAATVEIRKVVWPTRQEQIQTTLVVLALVLVAALILMGMDALFGWIASLIIA